MIRSTTTCWLSRRRTRTLVIKGPAVEALENPGIRFCLFAPMAKMEHQDNGHKHTTETPDVSHVRNIDVTHEMSDVNVPALLKFVVGLTVMTIAVYLLMWLLFGFFNAQETKNESASPPGPMAMSEQESLPPEPRLQTAPGFGVKLEDGQWITLEKREPQAEYHVLREQWARQLKCDDRDLVEGRPVACLPVDVAIQRLVEAQGLRSRESENNSGRAEDYSVTVPTAASSGRVSLKGKQ